MPEPERDFAEFYARHGEALTRVLQAMTGDRLEAQDCVQEAFARAWQRWDVVQEYDAPEAWVRQVAWRLAVSRFRRVRHWTGLVRSQRPPADVPPLDADHVALVTALRALPEVQRRALVLHHVAGLSVEEVAHETGAPSGTVKARLSRGRAALALLLADDPEGAVHA